jgi:hypothetical protein
MPRGGGKQTNAKLGATDDEHARLPSFFFLLLIFVMVTVQLFRWPSGELDFGDQGPPGCSLVRRPANLQPAIVEVLRGSGGAFILQGRRARK